PPSEFVMTVGSPPSMTATTELVVPRSIPMILLICFCSPKRYLAHHSNRHACWPGESDFYAPAPNFPFRGHQQLLVEWTANIICERIAVNFDYRAALALPEKPRS